MGAVGGLLGLSGGAAGSGFAGPSSANILNPATTAQANTAYANVGTSIQQQQALLNALQGQNGIQNQSNVYNQLQNVASGQGPNPAQAMLNQATGQNVANQAALMAGQRGASQNVGLIARQAAQQGANTQQQAAGQGATMQAQQSLGALGQLQGLAGQQVAQQAGATGAVTSAQTQEQQNILNAIAQQNNANVGMQSNINQANASLAQQQMAGQQQLMGTLIPSAGSAGSMVSGLLAEGGVVQKERINAADGFPGESGWASKPIVNPMTLQNEGKSNQTTTSADSQSGPSSSFGQFLNNLFNGSSNDLDQKYLNANVALGNAAQQAGQGFRSSLGETDLPASNTGANSSMNPNQITMAKGGKVSAMVSPGEKYIPPKEVEKVAKGEKSPMEAGKTIPGKPKVKGAKDSYANDTVPKTLEEGGIVLPRSVTQSKHPHWAAHRFVSDIMAKKQGLKKGLK